jgi:hypothetical protein
MRLLLILLLALPQMAAPPSPKADISASGISVTFHLPDARSGYYRGTRFDWSGAIASLEWNGHEYFGQWFEKYDPAIHDAITGPVEEFLTGDSGLGYAEARVGEPFVRIGVGAVRKPDEPAYRRFATYEIVDHGKWTVTKGADRITFVHELGNTGGYAYVYTKTVRIAKNTLVLEHTLKNTGVKAIPTTVYNHNFFTIDHQPTGPDFVVTFPFEPRARASFEGLAAVKGRSIVFLQPIVAPQTAFSELDGFGPTARDYGFTLENRKTGAGVRVTGDRPVAKLLFWSAPKTICPEPYIDVSVEPGKESTWRTTYEFFDAAAKPGQ